MNAVFGRAHPCFDFCEPLVRLKGKMSRELTYNVVSFWDFALIGSDLPVDGTTVIRNIGGLVV